MSTAELHERALDAVLHDTDSFADWLYGQSFMQPPVDESASSALAAQLALGQPLRSTPEWSVRELLAVIMTDEDASVVMAARQILRQRYAADKSTRVMNLVWRAQDDREGPIEAFKAWRDAQEVTALRHEFDGARV